MILSSMGRGDDGVDHAECWRCWTRDAFAKGRRCEDSRGRETLQTGGTVTEARLGSETFDLDAVVTDLSAVGLPPP